MTHRFRFLSYKTLLVAFTLLIVLGLAPDSLHSQTAAAPAAQSVESATTPAKRSTTSLPPASKTSAAASTPANTTLPPGEVTNLKRPSLVTQAVMLSMLSLLPFIIMILTSFLKIVVVLSLLRTALGVQQAPPNQVINGVAFLLSLFIMYPTGIKMYEAAYSTINQRNIPTAYSLRTPQPMPLRLLLLPASR